MNIQKKYKVRAKKELGQNFLEDDSILSQIINATQIKNENIIEVGPGYGALTTKILPKIPQALHVVELDNDMVEVLQEREDAESWSNNQTDFQIIHSDVLKIFDFGFSDYKVIANIPYYITSPILYHFLYSVKNQPKEMIILMQKDVADKILKQYHHKKPKSSVLSLFLAKKTHIRKICDVDASCFAPVPKVDSSVLHFEFHDDYTMYDDEGFLEYTKKAFSEPRKKLLPHLIKVGYSKELLEKYFIKKDLDQRLRPEDLSIQQHLELYENCKEKK